LDESDILIRDMTEADLSEVAERERELFTDPWPESVFREDIVSPYSYPFVLQANDEIAGYAVLWVGMDEGHLTNIAVAKKYQRKSIAKKLLSFILRLALDKGLVRILLEVRPSNAAAVSLYEAFGFERLAIRRDYYRNPVEDCLVMRKEISGSGPS
jgi:ribosomal-protein-alanine N-acetyltransferase